MDTEAAGDPIHTLPSDRESELRQPSHEFLTVLREAARGENFTDITAPEWAEVRETLSELSRTRRQQGFTPSETAMFVFSLRHVRLVGAR